MPRYAEAIADIQRFLLSLWHLFFWCIAEANWKKSEFASHFIDDVLSTWISKAVLWCSHSYLLCYKKTKEQENGHHNKCMYILALIEMCKKLCGENSAMSRSNRDINLKKVFDRYYSQVYTKIKWKSEKHKSNNVSTKNWKSSRQLNKQWKSMTLLKSSLFTLLITNHNFWPYLLIRCVLFEPTSFNGCICFLK